MDTATVGLGSVSATGTSVVQLKFVGGGPPPLSAAFGTGTAGFAFSCEIAVTSNAYAPTDDGVAVSPLELFCA